MLVIKKLGLHIKKVTDSQTVHDAMIVEKTLLNNKRDLKRALALQNVLRIRAINSGYKVYNQKVNAFQKKND